MADAAPRSHARSRRALAAWLAWWIVLAGLWLVLVALAPGAYVVRIDAAAGTLLVHQLPASGDPAAAADPLGLS
jgi:hypothetical protein